MFQLTHPQWELSIVLFFNQFCGKDIFIDTLQLIFLSDNAIRSAILIAFIVGIWHYGNIKKDPAAHKRVLSILFSLILALGMIETMNAFIDSKRPFVTHKELMNKPLRTSGTKPLWRDGWVRDAKHGSFPSDTVAFVTVFVIGLCLWRRSLGILGIFYLVIVGILPKLYLGLHYPSDILSGIFIALISVFIIERMKSLNKIYDKIISLNTRHPYLFGVAGFYLAYIIAEKFDLLRNLSPWIKAMLSN